jgi:hypothetical protein
MTTGRPDSGHWVVAGLTLAGRTILAAGRLLWWAGRLTVATAYALAWLGRRALWPLYLRVLWPAGLWLWTLVLRYATGLPLIHTRNAVYTPWRRGLRPPHRPPRRLPWMPRWRWDGRLNWLLARVPRVWWAYWPGWQRTLVRWCAAAVLYSWWRWPAVTPWVLLALAAATAYALVQVWGRHRPAPPQLPPRRVPSTIGPPPRLAAKNPAP